MYRIRYNIKAKNDITNILKYITDDLFNPSAAMSLAKEIYNAINNLVDFPYANPVYRAYYNLKHEYRRLIVKNYIVFYYVNDEKKFITIARVLYFSMNYSAYLF